MGDGNTRKGCKREQANVVIPQVGGDMEKHDRHQVMGWEKKPDSSILNSKQLATSLLVKARKWNSTPPASMPMLCMGSVWGWANATLIELIATKMSQVRKIV